MFILNSCLSVLFLLLFLLFSPTSPPPSRIILYNCSYCTYILLLLLCLFKIYYYNLQVCNIEIRILLYYSLSRDSVRRTSTEDDVTFSSSRRSGNFPIIVSLYASRYIYHILLLYIIITYGYYINNLRGRAPRRTSKSVLRIGNPRSISRRGRTTVRTSDNYYNRRARALIIIIIIIIIYLI